MTPEHDFRDLVTSAYHALYDIVLLRTHPLADLLLDLSQVPEKERGWQVHNLLLSAIKELDPGPKAPPHSKEWRRHRLMVLRYIDGHEPDKIADQLAISRRQYFREQALAIEAVAAVLKARRAPHPVLPPAPPPTSTPADGLLQAEVDRVHRHEHSARLEEVIESIRQTIAEFNTVPRLHTETVIKPGLPPVLVSRSVLRQVILAAVGKVAALRLGTRIRFDGRVAGNEVELRISFEPPLPLAATALQHEIEPYFALLGLGHAEIQLAGSDTHVAELWLRLPTDQQNTILVIDDNQDMLELYERFLTPNHFQVVSTSTASGAVDLACKTRPAVILLDLMMPEQDGWEVLHRLRAAADTARIPVIICSVLRQRDLAAALGARVFLEKPITEDALLHAIRQVLEPA